MGGGGGMLEEGMSRRVAGAGAAAALLLCVHVAASQELPRKDPERSGGSQPDGSATEQLEAMKALQLEVKALEQEIVRLRAQVAKVDGQLERLHMVPSSGSPASEAQQGSTYVAGGDVQSICLPPFVVADDGIKRFRVECLASPSCDPPYFVDDTGIKRFRNECMRPVLVPATDACNPPYYLLEDGTKLFKLQCL